MAAWHSRQDPRRAIPHHIREAQSATGKPKGSEKGIYASMLYIQAQYKASPIQPIITEPNTHVGVQSLLQALYSMETSRPHLSDATQASIEACVKGICQDQTGRQPDACAPCWSKLIKLWSMCACCHTTVHWSPFARPICWSRSAVMLSIVGGHTAPCSMPCLDDAGTCVLQAWTWWLGSPPWPPLQSGPSPAR